MIRSLIIKTEADLKKIFAQLHDSEFGKNDFQYSSKDKIFQLKSTSNTTEFVLTLYDVISYNTDNLDKVMAGKATAGVFNYATVTNNGQSLTLISQDLRINLILSSIRGELTVKTKKHKFK